MIRILSDFLNIWHKSVQISETFSSFSGSFYRIRWLSALHQDLASSVNLKVGFCKGRQQSTQYRRFTHTVLQRQLFVLFAWTSKLDS